MTVTKSRLSSLLQTLLVFPGPAAKTLAEWLHQGGEEGGVEKKKTNETVDRTASKEKDEVKEAFAEEKRGVAADNEYEPLQKKSRPCEDSPKLWFDTVVLLDCTWNQTGTLSKDERLRGTIKLCLQFFLYALYAIICTVGFFLL